MSGIHGWLIVDKPVGPTSAQIVARLRRALRDGGHGRIKTGHGGTLDPLASGVLPIAFGEATKLSGHLLNSHKAYEFTLRFGTETTTLDAEGDTTASSDTRPDATAIRAVLPHFTGTIDQVPPNHSAIKVDGQRAYKLARRGDAIELPPRTITIHSLALLACHADSADFAVHCSKGTYVRSLGRDIARALGAHGHLSALRRTAAGAFTILDAIGLDKCCDLLQGPSPQQSLLPLTAGLDDIPVLAVEPAEALALKHGQRTGAPAVSPGQYIATCQSVPVALVRVCDRQMAVVRGFNLEGDNTDVDYS